MVSCKPGLRGKMGEIKIDMSIRYDIKKKNYIYAGADECSIVVKAKKR